MRLTPCYNKIVRNTVIIFLYWVYLFGAITFRVATWFTISLNMMDRLLNFYEFDDAFGVGYICLLMNPNNYFIFCCIISICSEVNFYHSYDVWFGVSSGFNDRHSSYDFNSQKLHYFVSTNIQIDLQKLMPHSNTTITIFPHNNKKMM